MGQGYSLTTLSAGAAGIDMGDISDLGFEATIGDARFMKTVRGRHRQGLVVAKIVTKPYTGTDFSKYLTAITRERQLLEDIPNVLAYQRAFETVGYGYLLRQYMYSSLYERLSTQPFLEHIEKKWLAFQLLIAVRECHAKDVYHGDIKSENVLVTSWNWLYLSDFSGSFKPVYLPEDNPADFSFFFDLSGRRTCYLAPERFLSPGELMDDRTTVTWAMDIFSVGCVIAELFLETPMFNLSQLLNYKQGQTNPLQTHLHKLEDPELRELVVHMTQLEPEARYSADEYLNFWRGKAFPDYFYNFLHQYMSLITDPTSGRAPITTGLENLGEADDRIGRVYHDLDKIAYFLDYAPDSTIRNTRGHDPPKSVHASLSSFGATNHERSAPASLQKVRSHTEDGTFIFMTVVTSSMRNTARATARLQAIDLLLVFARHLPDSAKLDRILPFLYSAMLDPSEVVRLAALQAIAHLLIITDTASPINAYTPSDYLLQYFDTLFDKANVQERPEIRAMYAQSLSPLAEAAARFSDTISALRSDGSQQLLFPGINTTIARAATYGQISPQRAALVRLETHTKTLLHDESVVVRRALLLSIDTLCVFFGSAKTNDAILSHLNTLFTETDWRLKCSLFDTVANVAVCVGPTSVEEYILPMLILALYDREEFVMERVLASMARIARLGLFRASRLHSLIDLIGRFTMHPNVWVQGASLSFISWANRSLGMADVCCVAGPLLKPYLERSPADLVERDFIKLLKKPVARSAYNIALKWAQTSGDSLFWINIKKRMSVNRIGSAAPAISARDLTVNALAKIPKDNDDQRWVTRLRDAGMLHEDEVKFLALSESILRVRMIEQANDDKVVEQHARSDKTRLSRQTLTEETSNVLGDHARTDKVKTRPSGREIASASIEKPQTIADALLDASSTIGTGSNQGPLSVVPDRVFRTDTARSETDRIMRDPKQFTFGSSDMDGAETVPRSNTPSDGQWQTRPATDPAASSSPHPNATARKLMQWQSAHGKANAETSMSSMNVLGEVDRLNSREASGQASPNPTAARNAEDRNTRHGTKLARNVDQLQAQQRGKSSTSDSSQVIDLGQNLTPMHQPVNLETSEQSSKTTWCPTGTMVAMFTEHTAGVSCIAISPNHAFIITGCDDGCVKIWDTSRLERNVAHRSRLTYRHDSTARICSLCFVGKRSTFAAATSDGRVTLINVDCRESSEHTMKYTRLEKVYQWAIPAASKSGPLQMTYLETVIDQRAVCLLLVATHDSKVHALNVHTTGLEYNLTNPIHHGALTSVCPGPPPHHWLMLGTAHGVLDLWDLRFRICIRSVAFLAALPINSIQLKLSRHATESKSASTPSKRQVVYVTGGSGSSDITAWDIHELRCTDVYRARVSEVSLSSATRPASVDRANMTLSPLEDLSLAPTDIKRYTTWNPDVARDDTMLRRFSSSANPQIDASSSTSTSIAPSQQTHSTMRAAASNGFRALFVGQRSHVYVTSATSTNMTGNASRVAPYLITAGPGAALRFWDLKDERTFSRNSGFISGSPYDSREVLSYEVTGRRDGITVHEERTARGAEAALVPSSKPDISKGSVVGSKDGNDNGGGKNTGKVGRSKGGLRGLGAEALFHRHSDAILAIAVVERPYPMVVSADRSGVVFVWA